MRSTLRRHPLIAFFVAAYLVSALFGVPVIVAARGVTRLRVPGFLGPLAAVGPTVAALAVVAATEGTAGLRLLWLAAIRRPAHPGYLVFALGLVPLLLGIAYAAAGSLRQALPVVATRLPLLVPMFLLLTLLAGVGEEVGWRGFAQLRLQERWHPLPAALLVGALWAGWHLPLFLVPGSAQGRLWRALGAWGVAGYSAHVVLTALLYAWLLNASGGSLLMPILMHGGTNTFSWLVALDNLARFGLLPTYLFVALHAAVTLLLVWRRPALGKPAVAA